MMTLPMMMRTAAAKRSLLSLFPPPLWAGESNMTELSRTLIGRGLVQSLSRSSLRTQGPQRERKRSSRRRGLSLRHSSRGLFSLLRPGVMGPCVRRDDVLRSVLLATALLAALPAAASAQARDNVIAAPVLRADVTVSCDLV